MMYISDMPTAKPLYAKRLSDNKEFFVCLAYSKDNSFGVSGVSLDGEKADLNEGTFELFRK